MDSPLEQKIKGNWKQLRGHIQEAWGDLTDDDLDRHEGKVEQLVGKIEAKTGETRADIRRRLDELAAK